MNCGSIRYREYAPSPALAQHVRAIFTFSSSSSSAAPRLIRETIFPSCDSVCPALFADSNASIIINLSDSWRVNSFAHTRATFVGPMTRGHATSLNKEVDAIGVYLHPASATVFLRESGLAITNRVISLDDAFGARGSQLLEDVGAATTQRIALLEQFLLQQFATSQTQAFRIRSLCADLSQLNASVQSVAATHGISRQYLARMLNEHIGVSPKLFARLARFRRSLGLLSHHADHAGVAAQLGYVDQSHMIAEFREFTTLTPTAFLKSQRFHPFAA